MEEQDKKTPEPNFAAPDMTPVDMIPVDMIPVDMIPVDMIEKNKNPEEVKIKYNLLELIYGVLFDPGRTFKKVAAAPPLWLAVLIYTITAALSSVMSVFVNLKSLPAVISGYPAAVAHMAQGALPAVALFTILLQFVKWFLSSAVLHLVADFYGGRGKARGVFTVYGLAVLPALFIIPFQFLSLLLFPAGAWLRALIIIISLAISVWSVVLLVIGIKNVHDFSTAKSAAVVFTPLLAIFALMLIVTVTVISFISTSL